jgi:hypothetical protein
VVDLLVDRLLLHVSGHEAGQELLKRKAEEAGHEDREKEPHEKLGQQASEAEAAVEEDERQREATQPEVALEPKAEPADAVVRALLAHAQQSREEKERRSRDAEGKPLERAARGATGEG